MILQRKVEAALKFKVMIFNVWVYFSSLDDLLKAGINKASHLVVVNRETEQNMAGEETLADSETILAVQTVFRCVRMFGGGGWWWWFGVLVFVLGSCVCVNL